MAAKYHIKDDGTPGQCSAQSSDTCPKTAAGDSFHGTLAEAQSESKKRFEGEFGKTATVSKSKPSDLQERDSILSDYDSKIMPIREQAQTLISAANRARTAVSSKRAQNAYAKFNEETGYADMIQELNERSESLGYSGISEVRASVAFSARKLGNDGAPVPPGLKRDQVTPYSFGESKGWIVALGDESTESQYFFKRHENGAWSSHYIDKNISPTEWTSALERRPDNLKTFYSEVASSDMLSTPKLPLAGKYSIDPESE